MAAQPPPVADGAGLLLLEHLNLNVLSMQVACQFYEALGCSRDMRRPADKTLHTNCGPLTQFHTPSPETEAYIASAGAQLWRGEVEILYADQAAAEAAVARVRALLAEPAFAESQLAVEVVEGVAGGVAKVRCPWGNRFAVAVADAARVAALGPGSGARPGSEASAALALAGVSLRVPPGTAARGARFYAEALGFRTEQLGEGRWAILGGPSLGSASSSQRLVFEEVEGESGGEVGEHMAIYIGDFAGCFQRLAALGLIWVNPRFLYLDKSETLEEAVRDNCFRFKDVVDITTGEKLFELEHEVRSTGHPSCPLTAR